MSAQLLFEIEGFLKRNAMSPSTFGRLSVRDPRLVFDLRRGQQTYRMRAERIRAFMRGEDERRGEAFLAARPAGLLELAE